MRVSANRVGRSSGGEMEVMVKSPTVKHRIPVVRVTNWLRSAGNPREVALKARLKQMLGWND
jgi:hypothetical protein